MTVPQRNPMMAAAAFLAVMLAATPATAQTAEPVYTGSAWEMFFSAVPAVKFVMVLLLLASLLSWTIWIAKWRELRRGRRLLALALRQLEDAHRLGDVRDLESAPVTDMIAATRNELDHSAALVRSESSEGIKERVSIRLHRREAAAARQMGRGVGILATIGSVSPFVGLFGTVWGIMHSFMGIAATQKTSLAVVAPGIAEALFATALGLVAAIPATIMYNVFARWMTAYKAGLGDSASLILCLLSRDLDHDVHRVERGAALAPVRGA